MNKIQCCYKCPDRQLSCHDHCEKYKKERGEWEALKKKIKQERDKFYSYDLFKAEQIRKSNKRSGRK